MQRAMPHDQAMTKAQIVGLLASALLLAAGQVLFKQTALVMKSAGHDGFGMLALLQVPSFWLALVLYGSATVLWIYLLQTVPLSRAYPYMALGYIVVPIASMLLFGDRIGLAYCCGAGLIALGIVVSNLA